VEIQKLVHSIKLAEQMHWTWNVYFISPHHLFRMFLLHYIFSELHSGYMRAIWKVTSSELLTKQAMRKKNVLCAKNSYILKPLLNIVTTELRHLSCRGISFCMPVSKKSATHELSHILYCETQKILHRAIQNKRHGMLTSSVVLLNDTACPHTGARAQALLEHCNRVVWPPSL
jgi:hypothetical protein